MRAQKGVGSRLHDAREGVSRSCARARGAGGETPDQGPKGRAVRAYFSRVSRAVTQCARSTTVVRSLRGRAGCASGLACPQKRPTMGSLGSLSSGLLSTWANLCRIVFVLMLSYICRHRTTRQFRQEKNGADF